MRFLRFRLVSLFLLIAATAWTLSHFVVPVARQKAGVAEVSRLGGRARYELKAHPNDPYEVVQSWQVRTFGPDWFYSVFHVELHGVNENDLSVLRDLPTTKELWLVRCEITDQAMAHISSIAHLDNVLFYDTPSLDDRSLRGITRLRHLKSLALNYTNVTDDGMPSVASLPEIESVCMAGANVTDRGIEAFRGSKTMRTFVLGNTAITDTSVDVFTSMPNLEYLSLTKTAVTEAGLKKLAGHPGLKVLRLDGTPIDDEALSEFMEQNPQVKIEHSHARWLLNDIAKKKSVKP